VGLLSTTVLLYLLYFTSTGDRYDIAILRHLDDSRALETCPCSSTEAVMKIDYVVPVAPSRQAISSHYSVLTVHGQHIRVLETREINMLSGACDEMRVVPLLIREAESFDLE